MTVWYAQANAAIQTAANWHDAAGGGNALPSWPPAADDVLMKENERMKETLQVIAHYPAPRWSPEAFFAGIAQIALEDVTP